LTWDGALAEFPSAVDALRAAIESQQAMVEASREQPEDTAIVFRIGLRGDDDAIVAAVHAVQEASVRLERCRTRISKQSSFIRRLTGGEHEVILDNNCCVDYNSRLQCLYKCRCGTSGSY
jgi:hypothetical protein